MQTETNETELTIDAYEPDQSAASTKTLIVPRETAGSEKLQLLSESVFENQQLSLFQRFLANTDEQRDRLSNAMDLWDSVPRYSVSRKAMNKARLEGEFLREHERTFQHRGRTYKMTILPARVIDLDGKYRHYYPSATEELIEDALRKIATEQKSGYFDRANHGSGARFTLHTLRKELKRRGHARSYQQIVLALNILSATTIQISLADPSGSGGEGMTRSTYLPHLAAVSRTKLRDDPDAKWVVQFHPLVTDSIDTVTYRQYNYALMMSHSTQLARWLHKQLVLKNTFAELHKAFEMRLKTIKRDSGLLEGYKRFRDGVDALEAAFKELQDRKILLRYKREDVTGPRGKLLDVIFDLYPNEDFVAEVKAANRRNSDAKKKAALPPPRPQRRSW